MTTYEPPLPRPKSCIRALPERLNTRSLRLQALVWSLGPVHGVEREAMRRDVPCRMQNAADTIMRGIGHSKYVPFQNV